VFPGTWNRALFRVFFMSGKTRLFRGIEETSKQWKPVGLTVGAGVEQVHFFVFGTLCRRRAECEGSTESGSQKRRRKRYALVESLGNLFGRKGRCSPAQQLSVSLGANSNASLDRSAVSDGEQVL